MIALGREKGLSPKRVSDDNIVYMYSPLQDSWPAAGCDAISADCSQQVHHDMITLLAGYEESVT